MENVNGKWQSSFMDLDDPGGEITPEQAVVTVLSGSQGDGGHVSLFIEMVEPNHTFSLKTMMLDLTTANQVDPAITIGTAQIVNTNGALIKQNLPKDGDPVKLNQSHHASYTTTTVKAMAVIAAAERFRQKVAAGRYSYHREGGIKARLSTLPGTRAVNCADFVIKILNEAGVAKLGYRYRSTPFRVATQPAH